jgi:hypothetical protein
MWASRKYRVNWCDKITACLQVVLLTNDAENRRLAREAGLDAFTCMLQRASFEHERTAQPSSCS